MPSINERAGRQESVTQPWRALQYFTDRHALIRVFCNYLNRDPVDERVLFLHGDGGNGKSLLQRHLQTRFCKRLAAPRWTYAMSLPDAEMAALIENEPVDAATAVPFASLDFADEPKENSRPKEALYALMMMRRQLAGHRLQMPLFDFAVVYYLLHPSNQHRWTADRVKSLFPDQEMGVVSALIDLASQSSYGSAVASVLKLIDKRVGSKMTLAWRKRGLDEKSVAAIRIMDPEKELERALPRFFGESLNAAMHAAGAPKRVALFFDTHEAFWGRDRELPRQERSGRDHWLRALLCALDPSAGIVVVVAGRDKPEWSQLPENGIPPESLHMRLVGNLPDADAESCLVRIGIDDAAVRRALVDFARVAPNEVHPLCLGLAADVALAGAARDEPFSAEVFPTDPNVQAKMELLVNRLLSWAGEEVSSAVRALSACRSFDWHIYQYLASELHFRETETAYATLIGYSFVWPTQREGQDAKRIHDLLRRVFRDANEPLLSRAHAAMERYCAEQAQTGNELAMIEAIYHANQLDPSRGMGMWAYLYDAAMRSSRHDLCRALNELRSELVVTNPSERGSIGYRIGDFHAALARYDDAAGEYALAAASFDQALKLAPDDVGVLNNKGNVLQGLGELQAALSQHKQAAKTYALAVASYDQALVRAPDDARILNNKGNVLARLGDLQAVLSQHEQAAKTYVLAVASFDQALERAPDDVNAHNNKGNVLLSLGALQAALSQHEQAAKSYALAVASFDQALVRAPDHVDVHNNKGNVLLSLGALQAALSQHEQAAKSYALAVASYDQALERAPDDVYAHNNKGNVLQSMGDLQAVLSQREQATATYALAVASYDQALERAPDDVNAHSNKGNVLQSLGALQAVVSQHEQAAKSYALAVASYDQALVRAPDDARILNNKGNVLARLGDLQAALPQHEQAAKSYALAVASYDQALERAPDHVNAHNNKGSALWSLGRMLVGLSRNADAATAFAGAAAEFEAVCAVIGDVPAAAQVRQRIRILREVADELHAIEPPGEPLG
ncbi:MAG TPA: tetratricopeptide repeat protein [Armatimonadota bacterium]|jgi:tetratricopeptide (TPR) repeat protein